MRSLVSKNSQNFAWPSAVETGTASGTVRLKEPEPLAILVKKLQLNQWSG
jgi:hypothetical protein